MGEKLGQHFLKNKSVIPKIIAALDLRPNETVIEIGPGEGALTLPLAEACQKAGCKLIAIERDPALAEEIKKIENKKFEVITGDALEILPVLLSDKSHNFSISQFLNFKLVGNIPYYITGYLLRVIGELENKPTLSVLMIQKEVAERVCAVPPKMNLLAAATQIWAEPEIIARLKPKDFDPAPEVDSALIKLVTKKDSLVANNQSLVASYYRLIKLIFKQPRKTALNNLADGLKIAKKDAVELIKSVGLPENSRPQDFSLKQLIELSTSARKLS